MSLFLYFNRSDVKNITPLEGKGGVHGTVGGITVHQSGEQFYNCSLRVVDVLAGLDPEVISAIARASLQERWEVTDGSRTLGVYKNGGATGEVTRGIVSGEPAYVIEVSGKDTLEVCNLYCAIRAGEGQQFLVSNYDQPEGAPSYAELEAQVRGAEARIAQLDDVISRQKKNIDFLATIVTGVCQKLGNSIFTGGTKKFILQHADSEQGNEFAPALGQNARHCFR